jgi:hypothetical protein
MRPRAVAGGTVGDHCIEAPVVQRGGDRVYEERRDLGSAKRTRWLMIGLVLAAIVAAIVLVVLYGGGGGGAGY